MKKYFCLKCSKAKYVHSRWCMTIRRPDLEYNHEHTDLHRKPYCSWKRDYSELKRIYIREYNPNKWIGIGWYCPRCKNIIITD